MRLISASRSHGMKRAPEIENHLTRPTHHDKKELSIRLWDKEGKSNETRRDESERCEIEKKNKTALQYCLPSQERTTFFKRHFITLVLILILIISFTPWMNF